MRAFTNILFKTTLSSMILTAPAMTGNKNDVTPGASREIMLPYYTEAVIKKFVNYNHFTASPLFADKADKAPASFSSSSTTLVPAVAVAASLTSSKAVVKDAAAAVSTSLVLAESRSVELKMVI